MTTRTNERVSAARPLLLTACALVAFAANSVLCRAALGTGAIDAWSFTALRLASGAAVLTLLVARRSPGARRDGGSWSGAALLTLYALPFSLAYIQLDTGTGALLLFGAVQLTMIAAGLVSGERPGALEWLGLAGAAAGVAYLVSPGVSAPAPAGALAMVAAGVGWGLYSLRGRRAGAPLLVTAGNFRRATLIVLPVAALAWSTLEFTPRGALLAAASGALASGLGYAVWYTALPHLTASRAALVQLAVPPLAAAGGVLAMGESITPRLLLASLVILGSIALGTLDRSRAP
jgi:drug/metabolite transporter (DMT)-like permease